MIRRELVTGTNGEALILVEGSLGVVELHDMAGNIIEARTLAPAEAAAHTAWEAKRSRGRTERPTRRPNGRSADA
jgi:hypothetical protein